MYHNMLTAVCCTRYRWLTVYRQTSGFSWFFTPTLGPSLQENKGASNKHNTWEDSAHYTLSPICAPVCSQPGQKKWFQKQCSIFLSICIEIISTLLISEHVRTCLGLVTIMKMQRCVWQIKRSHNILIPICIIW